MKTNRWKNMKQSASYVQRVYVLRSEKRKVPVHIALEYEKWQNS